MNSEQTFSIFNSFFSNSKEIAKSSKKYKLNRFLNLCWEVLKFDIFRLILYGLFEGAYTLAGRQKWWEERHSGSTLVGVRLATVANQRQAYQRGPQPQDVDAQRADEEELSGIVSEIGNALRRCQ